MSHHKKHGHPVPPGNQPQSGPPVEQDKTQHNAPGGGAPFQEQDAQRRLGDYQTEGEHAIQQPSSLNDGQKHSR